MSISKSELSQLPFLKIAGCSYEGSLFGWDIVQEDEDLTPVVVQGYQEKKKVNKTIEIEKESRLNAKLSYGFHCTSGSLKTVAVSKNGKFLVTGGMDERIRIFNVKDNKSLGELSAHTGAITALDFFEDSYLISGSEDCNVCIWRIYDWNCVHILGGHKLGINDVAIHPSGKMALSVSKDNTMKLWNLVQGRCAYTRRLRGSADKVCWHSSGNYYMLVVDKEVQIYNASDNENIATYKHKTRVNQAQFSCCTRNNDASNSELVIENERIATICEDRTLHIYDFAGVEKSSTDITELGGRPRDMFNCRPDINAITNSTMKELMISEGDSLVIVTSIGSIAVLSCNALDAGEEMMNCIQAMNVTKAEPRFTSVVAWTSQIGINNLLKINKEKEIKNNNKKNKSNDNKNNDNQQDKKKVRISMESEPIDNKDSKKNKNKKNNNNNLYNVTVTEENSDAIVEEIKSSNKNNKNNKK